MVARTPDQCVAAPAGALAAKVHAAGSSLGTKNAARQPTASQYASTSGIQSTVMLAGASAVKLRTWARSAPTSATPTAAFTAISVCC